MYKEDSKPNLYTLYGYMHVQIQVKFNGYRTVVLIFQCILGDTLVADLKS